MSMSLSTHAPHSNRSNSRFSVDDTLRDYLFLFRFVSFFLFQSIGVLKMDSMDKWHLNLCVWVCAVGACVCAIRANSDGTFLLFRRDCTLTMGGTVCAGQVRMSDVAIICSATGH